MKDKILTLIIGILIGAIIASAGFVIYNKTNNKGRKHDFGEPPQMHQGQRLDQNRGTPQEIPSENNDNSTTTQNNDQTQSNT